MLVFTVQGDTEEAIIVATDEKWAREYADQMGFHAMLHEVKQPTIFIREIEPE